MYKNNYFAFLFLLFLLSPFALAGELIGLPSSRPFPPLVTDPRDIRTALMRASETKYQGDIGSYRSLVGWQGNIANQETIIHMGIEGAGYFVFTKADQRFPLESSDGLFGTYIEAKRQQWQFQIRYTHISAHLSDGLYTDRDPIRFSREFTQYRIAYDGRYLRPYIGYSYLIHSIPSYLSKRALQLGMLFSPHFFTFNVEPYAGFDWKIRKGDEGGWIDLTAGIAWYSNHGAMPVRLVTHYFRGHDPRGQFYRDQIRSISYGFELDL